MEDFKKLLRIGTLVAAPWEKSASVFVEIEYQAGRLSITGVWGPTRTGNARSCGQIRDLIDDVVSGRYGSISYANGWNREMVETLVRHWAEYHLNDMQPGSPDQTAFLRQRFCRSGWPGLADARTILAASGLEPDPNFVLDGVPYRYGSDWVKNDVPIAVLVWLRDLPDSDRPLPGSWA